jgi:hypothetical protein
MAVKYRYESAYLRIDNTFNVASLIWNDAFPAEQCLLTVEFAANTTANQVETKITTLANIIGNLKRT